ncbi:MAG: endonuclease III domain-containing protein [Desulfarculaceae bacterium]|jgi:endonuclease-3 related protein
MTKSSQSKLRRNLLDLYQRLFGRFGPQHWWPGDTPLEIMVGAVLTQNTNWANVSKAIANLKQAEVLSLTGLRSLPPKRLAALIRPAGYYNLKEKRLRNLLDLVAHGFQGDLRRLAALPLPRAREVLLQVKGIGPETADSILLYALNKTIFVVDAYTRRLLTRHDIISADTSYEELQSYFMDNLPADPKLFNEYHALLVRLGKEFCKKQKPLCSQCPAEDWPQPVTPGCNRPLIKN